MDRHGEMALLPLADEEAGVLLASVPEERRSKCWWFICPDGTPVQGDRGGGVMLFAAIELTRPLGHFLGTLRLSPVIDVVDKGLSHYRKRIGRFVPEGPAIRRYP